MKLAHQMFDRVVLKDDSCNRCAPHGLHRKVVSPAASLFLQGLEQSFIGQVVEY